MIEELSKNFKNIIVSTGASYDDEIQKTALILKKNNVNFSFLHCVTVYPTPINLINLNRISYLKKFTNNVGFSDHSLADKKNNNLAIYLAIYFGAKIIERHVRFYDIDKTKDGKVSILPEDIFDIKEFCKLSKKNQIKFLKSKKINLEKIKGDSKRNLTHIELLNRNYYRGRFATIKKKRTIFNWEISKI
jgi:sialic acid synthase SpsE